MKKHIYLAVFIFSTFYCFSQSQEDNTISVKIKNLKVYKNESRANDGAPYLWCNISIMLINHSDRNICFYIPECGWEKAFVTNNCRLCFSGNDCSFNPCIIKEIPVGKTLSYEGILAIMRGAEKLDNIKFKIGFKCLNYEKYPQSRCGGLSNYKESEILWSVEKTISVKKLRKLIKQ